MPEKRKNPLIFPVVEDGKLNGYIVNWHDEAEEAEDRLVDLVSNGRELDLILKGYYRAS
jgi:hypothetical protein